MLLRSAESHFEAVARAIRLADTYEDDGCVPFPYVDCRWLRREFDADLESLIPDLDMWRMDICGFASSGQRLLKLPIEEILSARGLMSLSFFEKHPEYAWLKMHITQSNTPDLFERIAWCDETRAELASLLDFMLREKFEEPGSSAIEQFVGPERGRFVL